MKQRFSHVLGALVIGMTVAGSGAFLPANAGDAPKMTDKAAERLKDFTRTGETLDCLNTRQIRSMKALDERHFLIEASGGKYYLNVAQNRCSGADGRFNYLKYEVSGSSLCRLDRIEVVARGSDMPVGFCTLGDYELLTKATAEKPTESAPQ